MTDLNNINPHFRGKKINSKQQKQEEKTEKQQVEKQAEDTQVKHTPVNPDKIMELMFQGGSGINIDKTKAGKSKKDPEFTGTIQVSKYVTPEQAERISASVNGCMAYLFKCQEAAINEWGLPQKDAQDLAVLTFENTAY